VHKFLSIATAATNECGPVASPRIGKKLRSPPMNNSRGLRIIGPMRALVSPSDSILVSLPLYFKLEHFIIYVFSL
jgi:hypothetical protein